MSILIFSLVQLISEPEDTHKNLGFAEMALSFGKIIGPLIVLLFDNLGYTVPFIVAIILDVVALILLIFSINISKEVLNKTGNEKSFSLIRFVKYDLFSNKPNIILRRNKSQTDVEMFGKKKLSLVEEEKIKIRHLTMKRKISEENLDNEVYNAKEEVDTSSAKFFISSIFNKLILLTFIVAIVDFTTAVFYIPVYTSEMKKRFDLSERISSLYLSIFYAAYFIGLRVIILFNDSFNAKFLMCAGLLINSLAASLYAPSIIFTQSLYFSLFGYALQNFFGGTICLNAIIDFTASYKKLGLSEFMANDISSAVYFLAINFSELLGPLIGGIITSLYSYSIACFTVGSLNIALSIVYFLVYYKEIYHGLRK